MSQLEFEAVIGLEVHVQLATESKIFCSCRCRNQGLTNVSPNSRVCPVCSGQPGALPVLNKKAVEFAVLTGLALECEIAETSIFARKNYFYPDLPKGYQISQFDRPLCRNGKITLRNSSGDSRDICVERIHLEEDAGKSVHSSFESRIDLNRAGTPLIEVVSAPEMRSPEEAGQYLRELYSVVTALRVCDGNLQEGNFRCDANVSIRPKGSSTLGTRVEIKNVNSFRFVEKAIAYEIRRQTETLRVGKSVIQETRLYDSTRDSTASLRSKEEAQDYRYFPDPDLPPLRLSRDWIQGLRAQLPELPRQKEQRYIRDLGLSEYDAQVLTSRKELTRFFEAVLEGCQVRGWMGAEPAKMATNLITQEIARRLNEAEQSEIRSGLEPRKVVELLVSLREKRLSVTSVKVVLGLIWEHGGEVEEWIEKQGLVQESDASALLPQVKEVLMANPAQVADFRSGKEKIMGYLVGQVMKKTGGKANPNVIQDLIRTELGRSSESGEGTAK